MIRVDVISVFPAYFDALRLSLIGKAIERGDIVLGVHDLRDYAHGVHRTVDDTPYGGGPGMVLAAPAWGSAIDAVVGDSAATLVVPSPAGRVFRQAHADELASREHLVFACGRYEGIDGRVVEHYRSRMPVLEYAIGDYVLAGGEVAALVMLEAALRRIPGVLGNEASHQDDSFAPGPMAALVEGPVFTRPVTWRGLTVPGVLRGGDHAAIAAWRRDQANVATERRHAP